MRHPFLNKQGQKKVSQWVAFDPHGFQAERNFILIIINNESVPSAL